LGALTIFVPSDLRLGVCEIERPLTDADAAVLNEAGANNRDLRSESSYGH